MSETREDCIACEQKGTLVRVPSIAGKIIKKNTKKVGEVVKQYIKDAKEEIKNEKKSLTSRGVD